MLFIDLVTGISDISTGKMSAFQSEKEKLSTRLCPQITQRLAKYAKTWSQPLDQLVHYFAARTISRCVQPTQIISVLI